MSGVITCEYARAKLAFGGWLITSEAERNFYRALLAIECQLVSWASRALFDRNAVLQARGVLESEFAIYGACDWTSEQWDLLQEVTEFAAALPDDSVSLNTDALLCRDL